MTAAALTLEGLRALRLEAQLLRGRTAFREVETSPGDEAAVDAVVAVVERLLALQGQDFGAVQRAIALRAGTGLDAVRAAFDAGRIVRGWPMRGTLFVTTPKRLAALGLHTRKQGMASVPRRREQLGLSPAIVAKAGEVGLALLTESPASRAELLAAWESAGIDTSGQRGYHLIATLSQEGLWHWGAMRGAEQLLEASDGRIELHPGHEDRAAAFRDVLVGYLAGHGPATIADLAWWTKASRTELKAALAAAGDAVVSVSSDGAELLALAGQLAAAPEPVAATEVHLLPAFDEYYLGYADRTPIATDEVQAAVVPGGNGMFRPLALSGGRVVGTWARGTRKTDPPVIVELLEPVGARVRTALTRLGARIA